MSDEQDGTLDPQQQLVLDQFADHTQVVGETSRLSPLIASAATVISNALLAGNQLLVCGNGGSAADAQHIAAEFSGRFLKERDPLPALALTTNTSALTAIGNDYGFDEVFARQVKAHGRAGDVLMAISTSGNSPNVMSACNMASDLGMFTIALLGGTGGEMCDLCNISLTVASKSTPRIQEVHALIAHILCGLVEESVCARQ